MMTFTSLDTPDGVFTVVERADGAVTAAGWTADATELLARAGLHGRDSKAGDCGAADAVRAYYRGDPTAVASYPIATNVTEFRRSVWDALRAITAGQVRTYGEVARTVGNPAASRAVGAACGANVVALFVPCHRVMGADGSLTGFAWGTAIKRSLLEREAASSR